MPHCHVGKTQGKEVFWVSNSSKESKRNTNHTAKYTARERWAKQRKKTLCASYTQLQKKSEELKVVGENCGSK